MLEITAPVHNHANRDQLLDYLASEGVDASEARSVRFLDDGRIEVEVYLRDLAGERLVDWPRLEVPTAVRTIDPIFCPPTDLIARLSSIAA